jgi:hypothetical protein
MASAPGVAGVRATLDLGSKSSKCVQCGEPDSARITGRPSTIPVKERLPTILKVDGDKGVLSLLTQRKSGKICPVTLGAVSSADSKVQTGAQNPVLFSFCN